jgi:hypothetical protein
MAQPVWILSVDLQAKTATFQTGLADAAKSARGAFNEIKSGSNEMGGAVATNMFEARHGVMLLGEEFGIHLPRALTAFITSIGPIGAAMEAAFPFLAIAVGATMLIQALSKVHESGAKVTEDQLKFGTAAQNAFNSLDDKLLQAGIRADELRNDHMGALKKQLELIDHQSMAELAHTFGELAKVADVVFSDLKSHWFTFGNGADGAKHALDQFQFQYQHLLAQGKDKEASDLLKGTRDSAQKSLDTMKQAAALSSSLSTVKMDGVAGGLVDALGKVSEAATAGKEKEMEAQQTLLDALNDQLTVEGKIAQLKTADKGNAKTSEAKGGASQAATAARQAAESMARLGEQSIAADRATADALLTVHRAGLEARLASDVDFAGRERDVQLATNAAELAALDKGNNDYQNQVKASKEKALEISNEYSTKVAELTAKATIAEASRDLTALQQSEREKIEATTEGSAARLAAINAAISREQAANLQDTNFYRELLGQRVETARKETEEQNKLSAEAGKEAADNDEKMGSLSIAALKQRFALEDSAHRVSAQQRIAQETQVANAEYANKMQAFQKEASALDKSGKDYENKLKQLQDKEKQLTKAHEDELTQIKEKAEEERNARILSADTRMNDAIASSLTKSIMGHQTWAKMVQSLGNEVVGGMLQNAIKSMLTDDMTKEKDAASAARKAFNIGMSIGGPAGMILGPTFAAAAFAGVMAFEEGGVVPGIGKGDIVPSRLEPGEGVVPGGVMDGLSKMARGDGFNGRTVHNHAHVHATYHVQTIDGDGMQDALEKNHEQVTTHIQNTLRRMNK